MGAAAATAIALGSVAGGYLASRGARSAARQQIEARNQAIRDANRARQRLFREGRQGDFQGRFGFDDIFGSRPEAALFEPIDLTDALIENITDNRNILPSADRFADEINTFTVDNDINRLEQIYPGFQGNLSQVSGVTSDLLHGRLPFDDVLDIVSDRQELSNALGTPGGSAPATLADLGLRRLDAIDQGANMFQRFINTANQISPLQNQTRPGDLLLTPQQRIEAETQQRVLEQASTQSANFLKASPDPAAASLFNSELQAQLVNAGLQGNVPSVNTGALLGQGFTNAANVYAAYLNNQASRNQQTTSAGRAGIGVN